MLNGKARSADMNQGSYRIEIDSEPVFFYTKVKFQTNGGNDVRTCVS